MVTTDYRRPGITERKEASRDITKAPLATTKDGNPAYINSFASSRISYVRAIGIELKPWKVLVFLSFHSDQLTNMTRESKPHLASFSTHFLKSNHH